MTAEQFENLHPRAHKRTVLYKAGEITPTGGIIDRVFIGTYPDKYAAAEQILQFMQKHGSKQYFKYYIETEYRLHTDTEWHSITNNY